MWRVGRGAVVRQSQRHILVDNWTDNQRLVNHGEHYHIYKVFPGPPLHQLRVGPIIRSKPTARVACPSTNLQLSARTASISALAGAPYSRTYLQLV
jgi:hypothetical protein